MKKFGLIVSLVSLALLYLLAAGITMAHSESHCRDRWPTLKNPMCFNALEGMYWPIYWPAHIGSQMIKDKPL